MTASLQAHVRETGLPDHFTMHSFSSGRLPHQIPGRDYGGRDTENRWLEDGGYRNILPVAPLVQVVNLEFQLCLSPGFEPQMSRTFDFINKFKK